MTFFTQISKCLLTVTKLESRKFWLSYTLYSLYSHKKSSAVLREDFKLNCRSAGSSVWFWPVSIVLHNDNCPEPVRTAGRLMVWFEVTSKKSCVAEFCSTIILLLLKQSAFVGKFSREHFLPTWHHGHKHNSIWNVYSSEKCGLTMYLNRKKLSLKQNKLPVAN